MKIDNTVFLSYLLCPFKSRLLLGDQMTAPTDYQVMAADLAHHYKSLAQAAICREFPDFVISPDLAAAPSILEHRPSLILPSSAARALGSSVMSGMKAGRLWPTEP